MAHPIGQSKRGSLRVGFDRRLKLEFHGSQISSEAGLTRAAVGEVEESHGRRVP